MGLPSKKIKAILAKYPQARKIAVESLMSMSGNTMESQANLDLDTDLYGWNADTVNAITEGIYEQDDVTQTWGEDYGKY